MDIVLRESERLNETIRSFLAYARPQRPGRDPLDMAGCSARHGDAAAQQPRAPRGPPHRGGGRRPADVWCRRTRTRCARSSGTWRPTGCARCRDGGRLRLVGAARAAGSAATLVLQVRGRGRRDPGRGRWMASSSRSTAASAGHRARPRHRAPHRAATTAAQCRSNRGRARHDHRVHAAAASAGGEVAASAEARGRPARARRRA